ncbi:hypothetical protein D9M71_738840 [compost metagenome]
MLNAEELAQVIHLGQQVPFLLLDVERRDQRGQLVGLTNPCHTLDLEHLPRESIGIGPWQLHIGELCLDLGDQLRHRWRREVVWLASRLRRGPGLPAQALELGEELLGLT